MVGEKYLTWGATGALFGFCVGVTRGLVLGGSLLSFIAATPETIGLGETTIDLTFLGFFLGIILCALAQEFAVTENEDEADTSEGKEKTAKTVRIGCQQGNRTAWLYNVNPDALKAIGEGLSRRQAVAKGITEYSYNVALAEVKRAKLEGRFSVVE